MPAGGTGVSGAGAAIAAGPGAGIAVAAEPGAPTGCRPRSRAGGTVATGKVPPRSGWPAPGVAAPGVAAPGVAGRAERLGWNPGPPARPCSAWVAPSARGVGFGVSGEDQDPSGSRRGEGSAIAARQGLACGRGLADPVGAGSRGSGPTGASSPASWARMPSGPTSRGWRLGADVSELALWGPTISGLALSGLAADGCGARRNHPAGGATPGQELSSPADSPAACPSAAGSGAWLGGAWLGGAGSGESSACGWRGPGIIRPGGTDQGGTRFSGSSQRNSPVRCRSSSGEEPC